MGKGTPISQELKENIADDLALGYSFADIADRYGVSFSSIKRVKSRSPETPTAMENVPEDITADNNISTYSISEVPEVVKPELDCGGQQRTAPDSTGQSRTETDYEKQKIYIVNILKAELGDIDEEIRSFNERIGMLQASLEERRQKQAYLRDFIRSM